MLPQGGMMLQSYTILELLLALAVFVLVAHELNGIVQARRECRGAIS